MIDLSNFLSPVCFVNLRLERKKKKGQEKKQETEGNEGW